MSRKSCGDDTMASSLEELAFCRTDDGPDRFLNMILCPERNTLVMSLRDTLRKAAGLLIELPPERKSPGAHFHDRSDVGRTRKDVRSAAQERLAYKVRSSRILHEDPGPNLNRSV